MALSDLLQKIESDGKAQVAAVLADADKRVDAINATYKEKQVALRSKVEKETETLLKKQAQNSAERDVRTHKHIITEAKRTAINDVFTKALAELEAHDDATYVAFVEKQLTAITSDLKNVTLKTAENRVDATKKALKAVGVDATCEADSAIGGGFIVVGEDYEYDFTFARLLETHKAELEAEVAQTLFN